jgi:hypothetical protein
MGFLERCQQLLDEKLARQKTIQRRASEIIQGAWRPVIAMHAQRNGRTLSAVRKGGR